MRTKFQIDIGLEARLEQPAVCAKFGMSEFGRITVEGIDSLVEALNAFAGSNQKLLIAAIFTFESTDLESVTYYSLRSKHLVKHLPGAWDANFRLLGDLNPTWHGGWAPVSVPRKLVYSTRLVRPREIAQFFETCPDLVVSHNYLERLGEIDPSLKGVPLYKDAKLSREADGVKLLASDRHAPPCYASASVGVFKGLALNDEMEGVPGARFADIGLPVLTEVCGSATPELMRTAEPWSVNLAPGWIANRAAAKLIASSSKSVMLHPVLSTGTQLFDSYEEFWRRVRIEVEAVPDAEWCGPWQVENVATKLLSV